MPNSNFHKEIIDHLEFLGYEIDKLEAKQGYLYLAKADKKSNLLVSILNKTTVISARWSGFQVKALKSKDFFETINKVNQIVLSKWYYQVDEKNDELLLIIEADYYDYNKSTFGSFIEEFEKEIQLALPEFNKFNSQ